MKITITAVGSRGDVQPYVALAQGLQCAGHEVCLSAPRIFADLVGEHGVRHLPISVNPQEIMNHPAVQAASQRGNYILFLRTLFREGETLVKTFLEEVSANCQDADLIVSSMIPFGAFDIAQKRRIPFVQTLLAPFYPTTAFAAPGFRLPFNMSLTNKLTYGVVDQSFWQFFRPIQNRWRKEKLGLPPFPFSGPSGEIHRSAPTVMGYSPSVAAKPRDWPENVFVTGYWFLQESGDWCPPADLVSFLEVKPTPVYIGFGSMPEKDSARMTQLIVDALRLSEQRCVLSGGWAGLGQGQLPDTIYRVEAIPHTWLFPQVTAVVHHGGAGTTASGLRAGVPSIVTPYTTDQFYWASRVSALGVGPRSIPYHKLTADRLAAMICQAVTDPDMRRRAAALGECIRAEDGVAKAVEVIEGCLRR